MSTRNQNEDLFQDSRMSFGEHLEELRGVLIRSLIGIAVGCVIGFFVAEKVVNFLQVPLENALTKFYINQGKEQLRQENGYLAPEYTQILEDQQRIPDRVLVDPSELVAALRSVSPDFFKSVTLKPFRFKVEHFDSRRTNDMCADWMQAVVGDENHSVQKKKLWSLLTEQQQAVVERLANKKELPDSEIGELVQLLNSLLEKEQIHESPEFKPVIQRTVGGVASVLQAEKDNPLLEMKERLDTDFAPDLSERLNRLLIAEVFDEVNDVQADMVPLTIWKSARYQSQSLGATETFMIWMKSGIITGILIASPWVFFQIWSFVAAGLYPSEQKYVYFFLPVSMLLFFSGIFLAFFFVFEPVLDFLFSFNARMGISPQPRINDWLSFVMFLPLGFGIAFQLPLVMLFVNRIELVSLEAFTGNWRVAVVAIFALSMLLTPADPVSMIMLAIPLTLLYFLGIVLCMRLNKPSSQYAEPQSTA